MSLSIFFHDKFVSFLVGDIRSNDSNPLNNKWKKKINEGPNKVLEPSIMSRRLFVAMAATWEMYHSQNKLLGQQ